ncbi:MAG: TIGR02206 family membrane protein [Firmicutes bacterium]|nr:TIGR02206 family membrane protein [Bacillota bacterium]
MGYFHYDPNAPFLQIFGREHLAILAVCAAVCVILVVAAARLGQKGYRRLERVVVGLIVLSEAAREIGLALNHAYTVGDLPLHICSLAVFLSLIYAMRPYKIVGELLYCLCMPGALFALLFPGWVGSPQTSFFSLNSFFVHTLLFSYPLTLLAAKRLHPEARRLPLCFLLLFAVAVPIYFFNQRFGSNFFFLNYAPQGSPLAFFRDNLGWGTPGYIFGYFPLIAAVWALLYTPWVIAGRRKRT